MVKVIVNRCFGGFGLSDKAKEMLIDQGIKVFESWEDVPKDDTEPQIYLVKNHKFRNIMGKYSLGGKIWPDDIEFRTCPLIIEIVEKLGKESWSDYSELEIIDVPRDKNKLIICEYDGNEWVAEKHKTW